MGEGFKIFRHQKEKVFGLEKGKGNFDRREELKAFLRVLGEKLGDHFFPKNHFFKSEFQKGGGNPQPFKSFFISEN